MKLCGCKETCFVNGEKVWGRHGGVLCLHATEENVDGVAVRICGKTKERVRGYISEWQYKEAQQVIQPDNGYVCNRPGSCAKGQGGKCYSGFDCPDKAIAG